MPPPTRYPPPQPYPGYPAYPGYPSYLNPQAPFGHDPATTQIAVAQLCVGLFGLIFGLFCLFGLPALLGGIVWAIVDAILIFTSNVKDEYGRKLR
ncbi:MAG: hypothetical protein JOZ00_09680 [Mycobacterium sp.]|uniref:hypothetical protein n=1 Tax=Mycobacterium sp. TaxID=1785 RepID=UPI001ED4EC83|nr:hypothetical protein [Mycobacterium sp.]MBV8786945.1 hypothetical protein [Mycobacterium sp.]